MSEDSFVINSLPEQGIVVQAVLEFYWWEVLIPSMHYSWLAHDLRPRCGHLTADLALLRTQCLVAARYRSRLAKRPCGVFLLCHDPAVGAMSCSQIVPSCGVRYRYEELGDEDFQRLVQALLVRQFGHKVRVMPLGMADGGRDAVHGDVVFQVKFTRHPDRVVSPAKELLAMLDAEAGKIKDLAARGWCRSYVLATNIEGTGSLGAGTIDRLEEGLKQRAQTWDVDLTVWWRTDVDARVDGAPDELVRSFLRMLPPDHQFVLAIRDQVGWGTGCSADSPELAQADTPPALVALNGLPPQPLFIGRERELAQLRTLLDPKASGVVVVAGMAGVGKTALVTFAAHQANEEARFPGGVLLVDMRGYNSGSQELLVTAALASLLTAVGVVTERIPPDLDCRVRLWRSVLARRPPTLVVVDNVSSSGQVRPLLPGSTGHCVLVTSRHSLSDLQSARLLDLSPLSPSESVHLLERQLAAANPDDERVRTDPRAADRIGELCGCLPLAVTIGAALLADDPDQPLAEFAEVLSDERHRLAELEYDGHLGVRAAFDLSYRRLSAEQAQVFRLMGLNPGPEVGTDTVVAVTGRDIAVVRRVLAYLRRAHLVSQAVSGRGRWQMHDLLRLYSAELAAGDPGHDAAVLRMFAYYIEFARAAARYLDAGFAVDERAGEFTDRQQALEWLDIERPNLMGVLTLAHTTGNHTHTVVLCYALRRFLDLRKYWDDLISTHRMAIISADHLDMGYHDVANMLTGLSIVYRQLGQWADAIDCSRRAIRIYREHGHRDGEAAALNNLGSAYRELERWQGAIKCFHQAFHIFREQNAHHEEGIALNNLGAVYQQLGLWPLAIGYLHQAVEIFREHEDRHNECAALNNLGIAHRELRNWSMAFECFQQAIRIHREQSNRHGEGQALTNFGAACQQLERWDEAIDCFHQALQIFQELGDNLSKGKVLHNLGMTYRDVGLSAEAELCWQAARDTGYGQDGQP